jgi:hypothetical protein
VLKLIPRVKGDEPSLEILYCLEKYELSDALFNYYSKNMASIPHVNRFARFSPNIEL